MTYETFLFDSFDYQDETGTLSLRYAFEGGPAFEEKIVFPPATHPITQNELAALDNAFRLIFLLAGVSYYKAYVPEKLICRAFPLDPKTAAFIEKVYRNGLGEFAFRNKRDLSNRIRFMTENVPAWTPVSLDLPRRALVPVGGGKDSIVTLECLKKNGEPLSLFAMGPASGLAAPIQATIETSGLPVLQVKRTLAPNLVELNRAGALNGHVPITAILSAIAVASAILHGFDAVILSNEHSASEPNLCVGTQEINHQYSKSFGFEQDLAAFVRAHVAPAIACFSFLRPLSETAILRRFANLKAYHSVFRSCNTAFRLDESRRGTNWCGACPKCCFIFLGLAPFMNKTRLIEIFGKNLLHDVTQTEGFAELCGLSDHKPFECVGEIRESALLMHKLAQSADWKNDAVVQALSPRLSANGDFDSLFVFFDDHAVPEKYLEMLHACT